MAEDQDYGPCPGCGTPRTNTGAPIWEDYCPNKECTFDHDEFWGDLRQLVAEMKTNERVKDAAPHLLAALQLHIEYESIPADRGGENGRKGRAWKAFIEARDSAISKAMGDEL